MHKVANLLNEKYVASLKHYGGNFEGWHHTMIVLVLGVSQLHDQDPLHFCVK